MIAAWADANQEAVLVILLKAFDVIASDKRLDNGLTVAIGTIQMYLYSFLIHDLALLLERGVTQKEISNHLGLAQSYINRVLNGHEFPDNKYIAILAAKLDVSVHDLFEGIELPSIVHFALIEEKEES